MQPQCHVCQQDSLEDHLEFVNLGRVTSDCQPWAAGGHLATCMQCGVIQKRVDESWRVEAAEIYRSYALYHQSNGLEQEVFSLSGSGSPRSAVILQDLLERVPMAETGRMLDVGCGTGVTLRAAGQIFPRWDLVGTDQSDANRAVIESLPNVECFHAGPSDGAPGEFRLITMMHVLEHIEDPIAFLARLGPILATDGILLVEVPDASRNPFDLVVADHCSHFTLDALVSVVQAAGYTVEVAADNWVAKELTIVARWSGDPRDTNVLMTGPTSVRLAERHIKWLLRVSAEASRLCVEEGAGLFGTSIAATWVWHQTGGRVTLFVDEDVNRAGTTYRDCPVLHPDDLPTGASVLLALPWSLALPVGNRLCTAGRRYLAVDDAGEVREFPVAGTA